MTHQPARTNPIPAIEPFRSNEGDTSDFREWLVRFKIYLQMIEGPPAVGQQGLRDVTKIQYLSMNLGASALRSFSKTPTFARLETDPTLTFAEFLEAAKQHFSPATTKMKARFDFARRQQQSSETIDEYVTALRTMALDCQFRDEEQTNEELLCRIVQGISDTRTQQDLLVIPDLTLERGLAIVKANETARLASSAMRPHNNPHNVKQVNKGPRGRNTNTGKNLTRPQQHQPQQQQRKTCMGCGSFSHRFNDPKCPAKNTECRWCHKQGHFEKVCMAKQKSNSGKPQRNQNTQPPTVRVLDAEVVKNLHEDQSEQLQEDPQQPPTPFFATFHLADGLQHWVPLTMEVDTGASPSVLPYTWYLERLAAIPLKKCAIGLRNYDWTPMKDVKGTISTKVNYGGRTQHLKFYVRDGPQQPIAGRNLLCTLHVNIQGTTTGATINTVHTPHILQDFPTLLSDRLGTFPGQPHKIHIRPDAVPRVTNVRPIPLTRQEAVKQEIILMDNMGIWEKIDVSEWSHPLVTVPKADGGVRITTDLTGLNHYVIPERYPLPKIKDLFLHFTGATKFSKLDLRKGYYHIPLTEESKPLTTTITPLGLRCYNRLPMGLTDAASVFQRRIHQTLDGLPGVVVYIDDIIVFGKTQEQHDRHLRAVLSRLAENDFRLQMGKCIFDKEEIPAFGHMISSTGIQPDPKNIKPILEAPVPTSLKELQSFLGLVNFYNEFLPNITTDAEPMRKLTRGEQPFQWTPDSQESFEAVKHKMAKATRLNLFDPQAPTFLITDASDYGIGAVLTQLQHGAERPIAYFNKTFDTSERNYATTEKEALAILRSCEHWENLLLGHHFTIKTDHQALTTLLKTPKNARQSAKFQRWQQRLSEFDFTIEHITGNDNKIADFLSRLKPTDMSTISGIQLQQLQKTTAEDNTLQQVKNFLSAHWPKNILDDDLERYKKISNQLHFEDGLLRKENKIVIPLAERHNILKELHSGHPGIERMKRLLRLHYWWPDMDLSVQHLVDQCHGCQMSQKTRPPTSIPPTNIPAPQNPGRQYAIDISGPFNGRFLTTLIDYHSRFPEVLDSNTTTSQILIKWLTEIFDRSGNPDAIISDNGPQFTSHDFEEFLSRRDIHHYTTSVYNPQENGLVESFNRYLKYGIQAFQAEGQPWSQGLKDLITSYRSIPTEEGRSPAEIFYGRTLRFSTVPNQTKPLRKTNKQQRTMISKQEPQDEPADHTLYTGPSLYKKGQVVLTKLPHVDKGRPPYSDPKTVLQVLGFWTYLLSDEQVWHARKMKPYKVWKPHHEIEVPTELPPKHQIRSEKIPSTHSPLEDGLSPYFRPRRQKRQPKPPKHLICESTFSKEGDDTIVS